MNFKDSLRKKFNKSDRKPWAKLIIIKKKFIPNIFTLSSNSL